MLKHKTLMKLFVLNCVSAKCPCAVCVSYHHPEIQEICLCVGGY